MKLLSTQMFNFLFALLLVLPSTLLATDEAPTLKEIVEKSDVEKAAEKIAKKKAKMEKRAAAKIAKQKRRQEKKLNSTFPQMISRHVNLPRNFPLKKKW